MTAPQFPFRFSFEQARRRAKDLQRALKAGRPQALERLQSHHPEGLNARPTRLADAQLVVAREHGFESWTRLKAYAAPETRYQNEMITEGKNEAIQGPWEDQAKMLHGLAAEALQACGLRARSLEVAGHMGNFGFSDYGLAAVTDESDVPTHLVTVHYTYDDVFPFDEMHRQVASLCAWLAALGAETDLDIQVPAADGDGALCQRIDHRPQGPAAVCTVQRWVQGRDIVGDDLWEGWDLKGDAAVALTAADLRGMGAVLGRIHAHGRAWQRPDGFNRMRVDWPTDLSELEYRFWNKRQDGDKPKEELDLIRRALDRIARTRKELNEPWGLTHGDFRAHNCVVDGSVYKAIDFDLCTLSRQYDDIGWFCTDIATPELRRAFLDGYAQANPPGPDFLRLVEGALISARVRRCAWGGRYPRRAPGECEKYVAGEAFLFATGD